MSEPRFSKVFKMNRIGLGNLFFVGRCPTLLIVALSGREQESAVSRKFISTGQRPVKW